MRICKWGWLMVALSTSLTVSAQLTSKGRKEARAVVERVYPQLAKRVEWSSADPQDGCDVFQQTVGKNGRLKIAASSPVAACRGVYDFIRNNGYGISSWTANRLQLPADLRDSEVRRVVSPFAHHYYFNVVTYGYTMPYWDWARWEQEIDWMALHGFDMPLALVANEAISARVWKKLGLTDKEIADYFVGPAHLPWMRMGNISGIDGPMPEAWHRDQIALQHKILKRMRGLGMHPICPGFAGFVPQALKRIYPDVQLTETTWAGAFHNWMLSPQDELFIRIGKLFIEEWEKEFGKNEYYLVDSFNEMDIPFPPKEDPNRYTLLASYGDKVYRSIKAGNPDAVWVMQGWMFGYQRYIWDEPTLAALVSKVPDDKLLLLDLAVDYNKCFWHSEVNWEYYKGFFNKPWVYSVIPNMGGKSGMTGVLDFYANGHLEALKSANRGRLVAHGMAPEGIENNEVIYELLADAGWSDRRIEVREWLKNYSQGRYGVYNEGLDQFWSGMLKSVYGTFTDHPRYNWQFRPGQTRKGSIQLCPEFYQGIEALAQVAPQMAGNRSFEYDFREWAAAYAGGKLEELTGRIEDAYASGDTLSAMAMEKDFSRLMLQMDQVLAQHPTKDLQRWIDFARSHGAGDSALADYYEKNARRLVTIWGPPVDDYSARIWSGLIRDYYLPRWQHYFEQKRSGRPFDFVQWERRWVEEQKGLSDLEDSGSQFSAAVQLVQEAAAAVAGTAAAENVIGNWEIGAGTQKVVREWALSASEVGSLKQLLVRRLKSGKRVMLEAVELVADGKVFRLSGAVSLTAAVTRVPLELPASFTANNECKLRVVLRGEGELPAAGTVERAE